MFGNVAHENKKAQIMPCHIQLGTPKDGNLSKLFQAVTILEGKVMPSTHPSCFPKTGSQNPMIFHLPGRPELQMENSVVLPGTGKFGMPEIFKEHFYPELPLWLILTFEKFSCNYATYHSFQNSTQKRKGYLHSLKQQIARSIPLRTAPIKLLTIK